MKKILAVVLAAVMMAFCLSASAETTVVNWSDYEEKGAEYVAQGQFYTFNDLTLRIWIPNTLTPTEITDEMKSAGYIAYCESADKTQAISVVYVDANGMSLSDYEQKVAEAGGTGISEIEVNGLYGITYVLTEKNTVCCSYIFDNDKLLELSGAPTTDADFVKLVQVSMASLQRTEG